MPLPAVHRVADLEESASPEFRPGMEAGLGRVVREAKGVRAQLAHRRIRTAELVARVAALCSADSQEQAAAEDRHSATGMEAPGELGVRAPLAIPEE